MEVEGLDLVGLLEGPTPLPDDLDDLFPEELMQYLSSSECNQPVAAEVQQDKLLRAPLPAAVPSAPSMPEASPSTSASQSQGAASPAALLAPLFQQAAPALASLPAQPAAAVPRLVTTAAAQQIWTAMLQAACCAGPSVACNSNVRAQNVQQTGTSRQGSRECSEDSSDTDHDDHEMEDSKNKSGAGSKRKAPDVDWRQIEDPAERRRQRRLAKNRVTAARSRERKKAMWSELEEKLKSMENENLQLRAMLEQFARENATLKSQLLTMTRAGMAATGAGGAGACSSAQYAASTQARASMTMDPAAILPVFIVTLLVVCSLLPGDKACALLGSVLPLALVASLVASSSSASSGNGSGLSTEGSSSPSSSSSEASTDSGSNRSSHALLFFEALFRLLHMLGTLVSASSRTLQRSIKRLLFQRHYYLGRVGLKCLAGCGGCCAFAAAAGGGGSASKRDSLGVAEAGMQLPAAGGCKVSGPVASARVKVEELH